jgi:hypothetical protein
MERAKCSTVKFAGSSGSSGSTIQKDNQNSSLVEGRRGTMEANRVVPEVPQPAAIRFPSEGDGTTGTDPSPPVVPLGCNKINKQINELTSTEPPEPLEPLARQQIEIGEGDQRTFAIPLGHIPAVYADAFATLLAKAPDDVPVKRWHDCIRDAVEFLDEWGEVAARQDWRPDDLFGLDPKAPMARYDQMGICWLLKGERIAALTATEARFSSGLVFRRKPGVLS